MSRTKLILRNHTSGRNGGRKLHAPKARRRRQKFNPHARAPIRFLAHVNHAAFLLFVSHRAGHGHQSAHFQLLVEAQKPTVLADHHGFASLTKALAVPILPCSQKLKPPEGA